MNTRLAIAAVTVCLCSLMQAQKVDAQSNDNGDIVPNVQLNYDQLAVRFLDQATAGATPADIASLSAALTAHPDTAYSGLAECPVRPTS